MIKSIERLLELILISLGHVVATCQRMSLNGHHVFLPIYYAPGYIIADRFLGQPILVDVIIIYLQLLPMFLVQWPYSQVCAKLDMASAHLTFRLLLQCSTHF